MNRAVWMNRGAALAAGVLACAALVSAIAIAGDVRAVAQAEGRAGLPSPSATSKPAPPWRAVRPILRRNGASAEIAVGEYLNGRLGELGLNIVSVSTPTLRPLGGGLHLAEVRVDARGSAAAAAAAANWVAVNREAVRMKSLSMGLGPDQEGTCTLVLLMVMA